MIDIIQIPALQDNYIYLLHDNSSNEAAVVDPTLAEPVLEKIASLGCNLKYILNTHHHSDHIGGNTQLRTQTHCKIVASAYDQARIPAVDLAVNAHDQLYLGQHPISVLATPGHTLGHVAYYLADAQALFCGDTLFAMGCGRLFEGSAEQLWHSLQQFTALAPNTQVYCAHEYTAANGRFALHVDPENQALQQRCAQVNILRQQQRPTVPFTLAEELATNPFLRADQPALQQQLGMSGQTASAVFAHLRQRKDHFS